MKFMLKIRWHHLIIDLILVSTICITLIALFTQIWFMQFDVNINGLQSKRYLSKPLLEILNNESKDKKDPSNWISLIISEGGDINYPYNDIESYFNGLIKPDDNDSLSAFLSLMVSTIPEDMSIVSFTYNGEKGLCFYFDDNLPYIFKIIKRPKTLFRVFIGIILFLIVGTFLTYRLKKNLQELTQGINRMKDLDFDTPIDIKHKNELSDVLIAFDDMRKQLKQNRVNGILIIMSITHDLKTPLTSIRGFLEAIKDGMIDSVEDIKITIAKMLNKTGLLEERIDEILDFSKNMNSIRVYNNDFFYIKQWLKDLKLYLEEESSLNDINYNVVDKYVGDFSISGDSKKLTRSILNLYDNACRYISKGDPIRFSINLNIEKTMLILTMDDGGPGVLPEDRKRIFDLFFRKDRGRNTRGMGIGLASVKYVSEFHGGSVVCNESELGGASFKISLPIIT